MLPLAEDEKKGKWKVVVRDQVTGRSAETPFVV